MSGWSRFAAVQQYKVDQARRTLSGIDEQVAKTEKAVAGKVPVKRNRFIKLVGPTSRSTALWRRRLGRGHSGRRGGGADQVDDDLVASVACRK